MPTHTISTQKLSLSIIEKILNEKSEISLSPESDAAIKKCRDYLDNKLHTSDTLLYGINTGFGALCNIKIEHSDLNLLQENLVRSHACGVGEIVPEVIIKLMLLLKIQSLAYGFSGVKVETVERLIYFFNNDLLPVVYTKGSLGASGDLCPLAHLSLPLIGEGEFIINGKTRPAKDVLAEHILAPLHLAAKEGLALLNGTQFMGAYGAYCLLEARRLNYLFDLTAALSLDAFSCCTRPFWPYIHNIRPHAGQMETAQSIIDILEGSEIVSQPKEQVQDPYSFRCIPQVHGATRDAIEHVGNVFEVEINSVTDNPNIFPNEDLILSGGNFHGEPLAITLDYLCIALHELGSISERRVFKLLSGVRGLPEFLIAQPGLNSGLMIPQYTAAALVSENKQLCTPASVDSISSSNGQEDHVSMGANAATKLYRLIQNLKNILSIEWLTAAQAIEFRKPLKTSQKLETLLSSYRKTVPFIEKDRILHEDIVKTAEWMGSITNIGTWI